MPPLENGTSHKILSKKMRSRVRSSLNNVHQCPLNDRERRERLVHIHPGKTQRVRKEVCHRWCQAHEPMRKTRGCRFERKRSSAERDGVLGLTLMGHESHGSPPSWILFHRPVTKSLQSAPLKSSTNHGILVSRRRRCSARSQNLGVVH